MKRFRTVINEHVLNTLFDHVIVQKNVCSASPSLQDRVFYVLKNGIIHKLIVLFVI